MDQPTSTLITAGPATGSSQGHFCKLDDRTHAHVPYSLVAGEVCLCGWGTLPVWVVKLERSYSEADFKCGDEWYRQDGVRPTALFPTWTDDFRCRSTSPVTSSGDGRRTNQDAPSQHGSPVWTNTNDLWPRVWPRTAARSCLRCPVRCLWCPLNCLDTCREGRSVATTDQKVRGSNPFGRAHPETADAQAVVSFKIIATFVMMIRGHEWPRSHAADPSVLDVVFFFVDSRRRGTEARVDRAAARERRSPG